MQNSQNADDNELLAHLHLIAYPGYQPGCSTKEFLDCHQLLFDSLIKLDQKDPSILNYQLACEEKLMTLIINLLNDLCSFCPRKELWEALVYMLPFFNGSLKNLPIGKRPYQISEWENDIEIGSISNLLYSMKGTDYEVWADRCYRENHRISNLDCFLLAKTDAFLSKLQLEQALHNTDSNIPLVEQYYLAMIAAATYGCRYLWNQMAKIFLKVGGDEKWLAEGISNAPKYLREFSRLSCSMAYNFKQLQSSNLFSCIINGAKNLGKQYIFQAVIILSYYQALSCICLINGLIPEQLELEKYLPKLAELRPSFESFECIRHKESKNEQYENRMAEEFTKMFHWDSEEQLPIMVKQADTKRLKVAEIVDQEGADEALPRSKTGNYLSMKNMINLETPKFLMGIYEKFVYFDNFEWSYLKPSKGVNRKRSFENESERKAFKTQKDISVSADHIEKEKVKEPSDSVQKPKSQQFRPNSKLLQSFGSYKETDFIYASEWSFEQNVRPQIEQRVSSKFSQCLKNFLLALRPLGKEKSKNLKVYYESCNNYMYQYISYVKLMSEDVSAIEKNYLKLITKSPFLFNGSSFYKMKEDLVAIGIDATKFVTQAVSFKLQLSINLLTLSYESAQMDIAET